MILRFCPPRFRNSIKIVPWIVSCDVKLGLGLHGPNVLPAVQARKRGNKMGGVDDLSSMYKNESIKILEQSIYVCMYVAPCSFVFLK